MYGTDLLTLLLPFWMLWPLCMRLLPILGVLVLMIAKEFGVIVACPQMADCLNCPMLQHLDSSWHP